GHRPRNPRPDARRPAPVGLRGHLRRRRRRRAPRGPAPPGDRAVLPHHHGPPRPGESRLALARRPVFGHHRPRRGPRVGRRRGPGPPRLRLATDRLRPRRGLLDGAAERRVDARRHHVPPRHGQRGARQRPAHPDPPFDRRRPDVVLTDPGADSWECWGFQACAWGWGNPTTIVLPGRIGEMYLRRCVDFWTLSFFDAKHFRIDCLTFPHIGADLLDPEVTTRTT